MLLTSAFGVLVAVVAGVVLTWWLTRRETEMAQLKADFVQRLA
jgi:ABC-type sulfate transport system permease component